ncbi:hypothetical protein KVT40_000402 [Elsinoe batatas]|uniref:Ams2/SPT21 N-terminal domain-containing protein n=1 Tax=Elsinoe batatas TaxID=2601811 RepID=A0A8K0PK89_9PEZI|nr:hypothetical protein KVT40_000402 [Elsinoe batatas]
MSSPAPCPADMDVSSSNNPFVNIPSRQMRVKILYTFDDNNKTNCLARIRDSLNIPVIPIDDKTHIGVIELRQCIRAVVEHSPEIVARLSQGDFTIYAYDYSEYETPQVGQGMLSALLAATSPTPSAPAHQSKTMITGRVCQNVMAAFQNDIADTLEVKLRLVPVPKPVQHDYIKSMEMYRNLSPALSGGFDPNAWSSGLNADNGVVASLEQQSQNFEYPTYSHQRHMSNASMNGRPTMNRQSRPSSRTSVRSSHGRAGNESSLQEGFAEEGPAPKRAKITQAQWKGRSAFTDNPDSLRVTASTAASIRVHKPVATRPGGNLEPPPRVPTPVPAEKNSRFKGHSFLRRESSLYHAETPQSPFDNQSDAVMSSPEDMQGQGDGSPLEFPSSPPAMPEPSSPGLPAHPSLPDSGYMSGGVADYMQDDEDRPVTKDDRKQVSRYKARSQSKLGSDISFIEQTPGPPELLPTRMNMSGKPIDSQKAHNSIQAARRNSNLALPPRPPLSTQPSNLSEPPVTTPSPFPDAQQYTGSSYPQPYPAPQPPTNILPPVQSGRASVPPRSAAASPAPSESPAFGGKPRSGSGAKRKKVIQEKLLQSLASGNMPTFCANCGAIETPTWRSLHVKHVYGTPPDDKDLGGDDETVGLDITERDEFTQQVTQYRIIKSIRKTKQKPDANDFKTIQVCNPCGLWFNKFKQMRPPEKWSRGPKVTRKKSSQKDDLTSDAVDLPSDLPMSGLWTDAPQPDDNVQQELHQEVQNEEKESSAEVSDELPEHHHFSRPRATSMQAVNRQPPKTNDWTSTQLDTALQRAIQSSPARFQGTEESPIELEDDLTPKPTRRLLFPSPRKDDEVKSLDDFSLPTKTKSAKTSPLSNHTQASINLALQSEKENLPPIASLHDDLDFSALFNSPSTGGLFKTPSKSSGSSSAMAQTPPSKSVDRFESLLATPTPSKRSSTLTSRTPTRMDAFLPSFSSAEKKALGTPSRYMPLTSPCRSIRSVSGRSVSGQSLANGLAPMTPFSKQLQQLLSDNPGFDNTFDFTSDIAGNDMSDGMSFSFFSPGGMGLGQWGSSPGRALDFGLSAAEKEGLTTTEDSKDKEDKPQEEQAEGATTEA